MKITLNLPTEYCMGRNYDPFTEMEMTLPVNANLEDLTHAFRAIMYALSYHTDTINETILSEETEL